MKQSRLCPHQICIKYMAAFTINKHIFLVLSPKFSTKNRHKPGYSLNQSPHCTHPFFYYITLTLRIIIHLHPCRTNFIMWKNAEGSKRHCETMRPRRA